MKKIVTGLLYSIFSVFWLFFSILFVSALWLEKSGSNDWKEDSMFIPIGIIMILLWIISTISLTLKSKVFYKKADYKNDKN